jgi:hypothetical protein
MEPFAGDVTADEFFRGSFVASAYRDGIALSRFQDAGPFLAIPWSMVDRVSHTGGPLRDDVTTLTFTGGRGLDLVNANDRLIAVQQGSHGGVITNELERLRTSGTTARDI